MYKVLLPRVCGAENGVRSRKLAIKEHAFTSLGRSDSLAGVSPLDGKQDSGRKFDGTGDEKDVLGLCRLFPPIFVMILKEKC